MTPAIQASKPVPSDLSSCDREPIHTPGSIQGHGVLLSLDQSFKVLQVSANTMDQFGMPPQRLLGAPIEDLLRFGDAADIADRLAELRQDDDPLYLGAVSIGETSFHAIGQCHANGFILEFEPSKVERFSPQVDVSTVVRRSISGLRRATGMRELSQAAAHEVRQLTGFDRVLVYRFDENWNGQVLGEAKVDDLGSYLDHWFPASDIPQQARKLYELNRLRLIADAAYVPVPLIPPLDPRTGKPLDMSFSQLRSVSPVHLEYLRNMGVASSMSISLLTEEGKLWGLIACHHRTPHFLSFQVRMACDMLANVLSSQIAVHEQRQHYEHRIRLKSIVSNLLQYMAGEDEFVDGLEKHPEELLAFAQAGGVALLRGGTCRCLGNCPAEAEILRIADWIETRGREDVIAIDCLPDLIENGAGLSARASGMLAISISKIYLSYILWFRPEVVQTVKWGGDPRKPAEASNEPSRLHPRKSFETWKEIVRHRSLPWHETEVQAAADFRNAVIEIVLRKAEEVAQVTEELQRSNKELEAFSYSVSHDLRAPFRHIVGYSELLKSSSTAKLGTDDVRYLDIIIESANFAGTLVDNLLSFSQVGRAKLKLQHVPTATVVKEVLRGLRVDEAARNVEWKIGLLPDVTGDLLLLRLVWQNLLQNALKFTRTRDPAIIEVDAASEDSEVVFSVRDNGVGFDQKYSDKLFGVFQRLHRMEDYEGTGIGLANVRRIIARHGGRTWAEGRVDLGAAFHFSLPREPAAASIS